MSAARTNARVERVGVFIRAHVAIGMMHLSVCTLCGCNKSDSSVVDAPSPAEIPASEPNILLVTVDTTRTDRLGCYGYGRAKTPVMDGLASGGVRYKRCYTTNPLTLPSHASIMTGVYPMRHHLRVNTGALDDAFDCLAERLKDRGYETGAVIGARMLSRRRNLDQGFDFYDEDFGSDGQRPKSHMIERRADAVSNVAVDWIAARGEPAWFLWVHYFDPHAKYEAPGTPAGTDDSTAYDLEIAYVDSQLERVLRAVQSASQRQRRGLSIVLTADHGEALGDHKEITHGFFAYNATIRVPLILVPPGNDARGRVVSTPVSVVDIYPTILSWAGLTPDYEIDGRILGKENHDGVASERRPIYFESYGPEIWYEWSALRGVVTGPWKYIEAPRPELYDLLADPLELTNRFGSDPARELALRDVLVAMESVTGVGPDHVRDTGISSPDPAEAKMLASLGYVGAVPSGTAPRDQAVDPKDMIDVLNAHYEARQLVVEGDRNGAITAWERALMGDPTNQTILTEMAVLLDNPEWVQDVTSVIRRAVAALPPTKRAAFPYTVMGIAEARTGNVSAAEKWLRKALEIDEHNGEAAYNLGEIVLLRGGNPLDAARYLRAAFEGDATNEQFADGLVRLYEREGNSGRALKVYEQVIALDPSNARAQYKTAVLFCRMGRNSECAEHVEKSLSMAQDEDAPWIRDAEALRNRLRADK